MPEGQYDAAARKERYERTKQLKGRQPGKGEEPKSGAAPAKAQPPPDRQAARAAAAKRVKALNGKLTQLRSALKAARAKAPSAADKAKKKTPAESKAEKLKANKDYYEKNKKEIAAKSGSKAQAPSKPAETTPEPRGVEDIEAAIKGTLVELKAAIAKLKSL